MASTARWARLAAELHRELCEVADLASIDPRWWLLAGGAALPWARAGAYVISDAEPASDTFIAYPAVVPADPIADAIARAHAARAALRDLDGQLPEQPLAVTIRRLAIGAFVEPSPLELAAFAIGARCWCAPLDDDHALAQDLAAVTANPLAATQVLEPLGEVTPFVCVTLGEEPFATARHGHRRAWRDTGEASTGPWLGLGRAAGMEIVSTSHMAVDGFGHARLASQIRNRRSVTAAHHVALADPELPSDVIPLDIAFAELAEPPRALDLAYRLGRALHRLANLPTARFSPTFQIPIAPGLRSDPDRFKRRVVPAICSVRFDRGIAEPFAAFEARSGVLLAREASGTGVSAHLLAAARGAPAPLAWKRRAVGPARPRWLESMANLIGGRGCVSKILGEPAVAVSSPARLATELDPFGSCVVTVVTSGERSVMTVASSGIDPRGLLDEIG
ncbi:MAG: hypothetical protein ABI467_15230 [Kofleriaceae bacterium]